MKKGLKRVVLKEDTLDSIVSFLAIEGETPLLRARAKLACGQMLDQETTKLLTRNGYDTNHYAAYREAAELRRLKRENHQHTGSEPQ